MDIYELIDYYIDKYLEEKEHQTDVAAVLEQFPEDIRQMMKLFEDGRMLRLPTEKEVFGKNEVGKAEPDSVQQWEPMKLRRNRITFQGLNGGWEWWWTETPHNKNAVYFAAVSSNGDYVYNYASNSGGVRPVFRLGRKEKG